MADTPRKTLTNKLTLTGLYVIWALLLFPFPRPGYWMLTISRPERAE